MTQTVSKTMNGRQKSGDKPIMRLLAIVLTDSEITDIEIKLAKYQVMSIGDYVTGALHDLLDDDRKTNPECAERMDQYLTAVEAEQLRHVVHRDSVNRAEQAYFTVKEAAAFLRLAPKTIRKYILKGEMQASRYGRELRISGTSLARFIDRHRIKRQEGLDIS